MTTKLDSLFSTPYIGANQLLAKLKLRMSSNRFNARVKSLSDYDKLRADKHIVEYTGRFKSIEDCDKGVQLAVRHNCYFKGLYFDKVGSEIVLDKVTKR